LCDVEVVVVPVVLVLLGVELVVLELVFEPPPPPHPAITSETTAVASAPRVAVDSVRFIYWTPVVA
jgi:hypothetical protein